MPCTHRIIWKLHQDRNQCSLCLHGSYSYSCFVTKRCKGWFAHQIIITTTAYPCRHDPNHICDVYCSCITLVLIVFTPHLDTIFHKSYPFLQRIQIVFVIRHPVDRFLAELQVTPLGQSSDIYPLPSLVHVTWYHDDPPGLSYKCFLSHRNWDAVNPLGMSIHIPTLIFLLIGDHARH